MSKYVDSFFTVLKLDYNGGWELVDSIKGLISDEINDLTMSVDDIKKELEDSENNHAELKQKYELVKQANS